MRIRQYFLILISIFVFCSCSKEGESDSPTQDPVTNLVDKYFIMTDAVSNPAYPMGNGTTSADLYNDWYKSPCVHDDLRMFKSNGDVIFDNGTTKCDPTEPQSVVGSKWNFIENNTRLVLTQGTNKNTLQILINDGTVLKYDKKRTSSSTGSIVYTWTESWRVK
jgi:hypothetical protein